MHIDVERLWRTETELRDRVENSPGNTQARQDLAWCLILLAMYQAGLEKSGARPSTARLTLSSGAAGAAESSEHAESIDRSAEQLLCEHLWHSQVLDMLPRERTASTSRSTTLPIDDLIGAAPLAREMRRKYETALRSLIADLQDPQRSTLGGDK